MRIRLWLEPILQNTILPWWDIHGTPGNKALREYLGLTGCRLGGTIPVTRSTPYMFLILKCQFQHFLQKLLHIIQISVNIRLIFRVLSTEIWRLVLISVEVELNENRRIEITSFIEGLSKFFLLISALDTILDFWGLFSKLLDTIFFKNLYRFL